MLVRFLRRAAASAVFSFAMRHPGRVYFDSALRTTWILSPSWQMTVTRAFVTTHGLPRYLKWGVGLEPPLHSMEKEPDSSVQPFSDPAVPGATLQIFAEGNCSQMEKAPSTPQKMMNSQGARRENSSDL